MDPALLHLIQRLHEATWRYVLAMTGGGTRALAWLLSVPGGSRTILEAIVPYDAAALTDFLRQEPEQFCSTATSEAMACRAYERAGWLAPAQPVAGVACTASLATDRPKQGDHRIHVTVCTSERIATWSLTLSKGARDRDGEEEVVARVLLNALAEAFGLPDRVDMGLLPGEAPETTGTSPSSPLLALMRGEVQAACCETDGRCTATAERPTVLLSGAFNPVHQGHWGLAAAASKLTGAEVAFELSVTNVDKPPLTLDDVRRRLTQFAGRAPVWLTRAPTFAEKAALFPRAVFVVGADTAERIVAPRYYGESQTAMHQSLDCICAQGCRFLVAARAEPDGRLLTLEQVAIPADYGNLFEAIPVSAFSVPVSSTAIRARCANPAG
jgi:nicotinic acid mononucleotide adenylyltransferase